MLRAHVPLSELVASIAAAARPTLAEARPLPAEAYTSPELFAAEADAIFARSWLAVGREDEVALPGQWLRAIPAPGAPVLVVRGADLRLRAFHDVCRHRGASIVGRCEGGRAAHLACPYHGWRYRLDGRRAADLAGAADLGGTRQHAGAADLGGTGQHAGAADLGGTGQHAGAADLGGTRQHAGAADLGGAADLLPVAVGTWEGFVFVHLGAAPPPIREAMGETPPWLASLAPLARGRRSVATARANWKLLVENFQESHHFPTVHAALEELTPTAHAASWLGDGLWLGGVMPIRGETVAPGGHRHDRPRITAHRAVHDALLFPTLLTSLQPDYLLTYRLEPIAPDATRIVADVHFHAAAFTPGFAPDDVHAFWDQVNAEDRAICEDQQANAASPGFVPAAFAAVEDGVHAFDVRYAATLTRSGSAR